MASRSNQIVAFFVLSFGLSWALWVPEALSGESSPSPFALVLLGAFAPSLAALLLTGLHGGRAGLKGLVGRLLAWRVGVGWYAVLLLDTAAVGLLTVLLHLLFGGPSPNFSPAVPWFVLAFAFFLGLPVERGGGMAGLRVQADWSALRSGLVLGLLWGLWHLPVFFIAGTSQAGLPFAAFMV